MFNGERKIEGYLIITKDEKAKFNNHCHKKKEKFYEMTFGV